MQTNHLKFPIPSSPEYRTEPKLRIVLYRYRKENGFSEHPSFTIPTSAPLDSLTTHCHDEHGPRLCEELVTLDEEGFSLSREKVAEVDKLRTAEQASKAVVLK
jgi:hypothetical protein